MITTYVENWPKLDQRLHYVTFLEINDRCWADMPWYWKVMGGIALACTHVDFEAGTCDVYVTSGSPPFIVDHEIEHCHGGDHDGTLRDALGRWKERRLARSS